MTPYWLRWWLVAWSHQAFLCLNQCRLIHTVLTQDQFHMKCSRYPQNMFENTFCKITSTSLTDQWVNGCNVIYVCVVYIHNKVSHYDDVIMSEIASQITSLTIVYSTVHLGADQSKSKLRVTGLCVGNSPVTGEFPAQMATNAENISIWWRHHEHGACWCPGASVLAPMMWTNYMCFMCPGPWHLYN